MTRILKKAKIQTVLALGVAFARLTQLMFLPYEALQYGGDLVSYFRVAQIPGWPFFHSWAEYPPIFPFFSELLYRLSADSEHIYVYLISFLLIGVDIANFYLICKITDRYYSNRDAHLRQIIFAALLVIIPYFAWYFESIVLFFILLSLLMVFAERPNGLGAAAAVGILIKTFPALIFPTIWKKWPLRKALTATLLTLLICVVVYGALFLITPDFTVASIVSQANKGSWETVWALIDGNYRTGNFGPLVERLDALSAFRPVGNPPAISSWMTLIPFLGLGFWRWKKLQPKSVPQWIALTGLTWCIFFLWLPGWSPQWVIYLVTLILLGQPLKEGLLLAAALVFTSLLEWPVLLSRELYSLWMVAVCLRTLLVALAAYQFDQSAGGALAIVQEDQA